MRLSRQPLLATAFIPIAAGLLLLTGWLGISRAEEISAGSGRYLRQQVVWSVLACGVFACMAKIDYRHWSRWAPAIYVATIAALLAVFGFSPVNGARRWIRLGGIGVQPSEFAKVGLIITLAAWLSVRDMTQGFVQLLVPLAMTVLPLLLILKEPDLGTSLVLLPILFAMLLAAEVRSRDLLRLVGVGLLLMPLVWSQMSREQRSRVTALWEQNGPREAATADGFHLDQAKRMFASGGVWGSFWRREVNTNTADAPESFHHFDDLPNCRVPEPQTDSIFCVIGERFGLVGCAVVLLLYGVLISGCVRVGAAATEPFGRLLAVGVAALFAAECLINTGMHAGLLPITGLSLPLVSYGGSGLVAHAAALGLVGSVGQRAARHSS